MVRGGSEKVECVGCCEASDGGGSGCGVSESG